MLPPDRDVAGPSRGSGPGVARQRQGLPGRAGEIDHTVGIFQAQKAESTGRYPQRAAFACG